MSRRTVVTVAGVVGILAVLVAVVVGIVLVCHVSFRDPDTATVMSTVLAAILGWPAGLLIVAWCNRGGAR